MVEFVSEGYEMNIYQQKSEKKKNYRQNVELCLVVYFM